MTGRTMTEPRPTDLSGAFPPLTPAMARTIARLPGGPRALAWWEREFIRYLAVGAFNTGLGQLGYWLLLPFMAYEWAFTITYVLGIVLSYVLNALIVFRQPLSWRKLVQFPIVYAVQWAAGLVFLAIAIRLLGISETIAPLLWIALSVPLTFAISRLILRPKTPGAV
jgi:putative flippase GtrA